MISGSFRPWPVHKAVVLRHMDWGEAGRLLWLFSREQGMLNIRVSFAGPF